MNDLKKRVDKAYKADKDTKHAMIAVGAIDKAVMELVGNEVTAHCALETVELLRQVERDLLRGIMRRVEEVTA